MPRADGSFEVLEKINENAYKVNFWRDYGVLAAFNMADLSAYQADDYLQDLSIKSLQQGEDEGVPHIQDKEEGPKSPTRSNASSKVQAMVQMLEENRTAASGLNNQNVPSFVHLIS